MVVAGDVGRLRTVLGIEAPILQSGMRGVAGPELAAAVSNAGGLGILAALFQSPDGVRADIRAIRELTDRPFGVNIWLHEDVRTPPDVGRIDSDAVRSVHEVFNELRPRFELAPTRADPPHLPDLVDAALEVMIEERIPVFSAGVGLPEPELVERFHTAGTKVVVMVASVEDAERAAESGADVVVAQGAEAGGHRSYGTKLSRGDAMGTGTFSLLPEVVERIGERVPVVAAGGIVDGRGLAAAIVLGASGVLIGTRFVATAESLANVAWKRRLVSGHGETVLTDGFTGQWARVVRSEFTDHWATAGVEPLPGLLQAALGADLYAAAASMGDDQMQPLYAGASYRRMSDLPAAGDVVGDVVRDATQLLGPL